MDILGRVVDVLETFPLQLTLEAAGERLRVVLAVDTAVAEGGESRDAGRLQPGQLVRIDADRAPGRGVVTARAIEILKPRPPSTEPPVETPVEESPAPQPEYDSSDPTPPPKTP